MSNRRIAGWFGMLALVLTIFAADSFAQKNQSAQPQKKAPEKPLPNLVLDTVDGKRWSLNENRGSVVLLNFWATWCEPCRTETPVLVKLADEFEAKGLKVVGIALDQDGTEKIKKFMVDYGIDYPVLLPVPGSLLSQIDPVPTTLLIDAEGRLAKKYVGAMPEKLLREHIVNLTGEPAGAKSGAKKKQTAGTKK